MLSLVPTPFSGVCEGVSLTSQFEVEWWAYLEYLDSWVFRNGSPKVDLGDEFSSHMSNMRQG